MQGCNNITVYSIPIIPRNTNSPIIPYKKSQSFPSSPTNPESLSLIRFHIIPVITPLSHHPVCRDAPREEQLFLCSSIPIIPYAGMQPSDICDNYRIPSSPYAGIGRIKNGRCPSSPYAGMQRVVTEPLSISHPIIPVCRDATTSISSIPS